jgi:hypothetical protein
MAVYRIRVFFTGKQPRRQPVIAPSEAFTKGLSKALAKVYPYELEHIVSYFDAGMKLGQMLKNRNQTDGLMLKFSAETLET